jgi:hypothetical protein
MAWIRLASIRDVRWGPYKSVGNAPGLSVLIQVNDPDDIVIAVSGFDEIGHTFANRASPAGSAHNYTNKGWIELQHIKATLR